MTIRTLSLHFDLPIAHRQVPQWRGAFAEFAGVENDLFHNHKNELENEELILKEEMFHYRYPLIQYRIHKGQASVFALNDGIESLQSVLSNNAWRIHWEGEPRPLQITGMQMQEYTLRMLPRPKTYRLFKWLALNAENYEKWQQCNSLVERITLLERILTAHIIAFAGGVGWHIPERLEIHLQDIQGTDTVRCHGIPLLAFNLTYTANVLLPPHIALGKGVSHAYGWQVPHRAAMPNRGAKTGLVRRTEEF